MSSTKELKVKHVKERRMRGEGGSPVVKKKRIFSMTRPHVVCFSQTYKFIESFRVK